MQRTLRSIRDHGLAARRSNPERVAGAQGEAAFLQRIERLLRPVTGDGATSSDAAWLRLVEGARPFADMLDAFLAAERGCRPGDLIAVSGIYPNHCLQAGAERRVRNWSGEAWKLKRCLERHRPDLKLLAIDVSPAGLLLVGRLDPGSRYLPMLRDRLLAEYGTAEDPPAAVLTRGDAVDPRAPAVAALVATIGGIVDPAVALGGSFRRSDGVRRGDAPAPAAGIYLTHIDDVRIRGHFDRLVRETAGAIDWRFGYNPGTGTSLRMDVPFTPAETLMPLRHAACRANGSVLGGFVDVAYVPAALAGDHGFTWILEYDVDYAGHWMDLFAQFAASEADLITTSLATRAQTPDWSWWPGTAAPEPLSDDAMIHAFMPIARFSRRLLRTYVTEVERGWRGHFEFTMPTLAAAHGFTIEDIGGGRDDDPSGRRPNYLNNPVDMKLRPGTFVWRPARRAYYHECASGFELPDMLYHPVKPEAEA